jgi:hypothetical protein
MNSSSPSKQPQNQHRPSTPSLANNKNPQQAQQLLYQGETFVINERSYFI